MNSKHVVVIGNDINALLSAISIKKQCNVQLSLVNTREQTHKQSTVTSLSDWGIHFHHRLQLQESEFILKSKGSFCIGDWHCANNKDGDNLKDKNESTDKVDFVIGSGETGTMIQGLQFQHFLTLLANTNVANAPSQHIEDYSLSAKMARANKFVLPVPDSKSILSTLSYSGCLHLPVYEKYIQAYAKHLGIVQVTCGKFEPKIVEGKVVAINADDEVLQCDLVIDGSANNQVFTQLAGLTKNAEDRKTNKSPISSFQHSYRFTIESSACSARKIQHYDSCLLVSTSSAVATQYELISKNSLSQSEVVAFIKRKIDLEIEESQISQQTFDITEPNNFWLSNCVRLLPRSQRYSLFKYSELELNLRIVDQLCLLFPVQENMEVNAIELNSVIKATFSKIVDFESTLLCLIAMKMKGKNKGADLSREDTSCLSSDMQHKVKLFQEIGKLAEYTNDPIETSDWLNLFYSLGIIPNRYDPMINTLDKAKMMATLQGMELVIEKMLVQLPCIIDYIKPR